MNDSSLFVRLSRLLESDGVPSVLRALNDRTPHRFTGVYRFDDPMLRNLHLVDAFERAVARGDDAPMVATFCALVRETGALAFTNAGAQERTARVETPVVSYCGVLLADAAGKPFGTLCHFDTKPCDAPAHDLDLLAQLAPLVAERVAS